MKILLIIIFMFIASIAHTQTITIKSKIMVKTEYCVMDDLNKRILSKFSQQKKWEINIDSSYIKITHKHHKVTTVRVTSLSYNLTNHNTTQILGYIGDELIFTYGRTKHGKVMITLETDVVHLYHIQTVKMQDKLYKTLIKELNK